MAQASTIEPAADGCARLRGAMSFETAPGLYREMERLAAGGTEITCVDLAGVTAADSAGLALLLEWQARSRAARTPLAVVNAPDSLMRLARLAEAAGLMQLSGRKSAP